MHWFFGTLSLFSLTAHAGFGAGTQEPLKAPIDPLKYKAACPDYKNYAMRQQYAPYRRRKVALIAIAVPLIAQDPLNYLFRGPLYIAVPLSPLWWKRS